MSIKVPLPFLKRGKNTSKNNFSLISPPDGVFILGKHQKYKGIEDFITTPVWLYMYNPLLKKVAKGYNLYVVNQKFFDLISPECLEKISLQNCKGEIKLISPTEEIQPKEVLTPNDLEKKGAVKIAKKLIKTLIEYPLTCESSMWKEGNQFQREFIALFLLKRYGEKLVYKAFSKWSSQYPEIRLCGIWIALIEILTERINLKEVSDIKEWLVNLKEIL